MLKDYLSEKNISIYRLSKLSALPYTTVNDLANGRVEVGNCKSFVLKSLSSALKISMDDLYDLCSEERVYFSTRRDTKIKLSVSDKTYFADFEYAGIPRRIRVAPVNDGTTYYIDELVVWRVEESIDSYILEAF